MIWAVLAFVGVPLWLCALGIAAVVFRNRGLRSRHCDMAVRVQRPGKTRWTRAHAVWVGPVFAWRGSPAAWAEELDLVVGAELDELSSEDRRSLHRLDEVAVVRLVCDDGRAVRVATTAADVSSLLGPFGAEAASL